VCDQQNLFVLFIDVLPYVPLQRFCIIADQHTEQRFLRQSRCPLGSSGAISTAVSTMAWSIAPNCTRQSEGGFHHKKLDYESSGGLRHHANTAHSF
jgi:hypothetical protein